MTTLKPTKCAECAKTFTPARPGMTFCQSRCKTAFHNRSGTRGRTIMPMLLAWRQVRGKGPTAKTSFYEVCRQLDAWNAEDLKAGRARPEGFVTRQMAGGLNRHFRA